MHLFNLRGDPLLSTLIRQVFLTTKKNKAIAPNSLYRSRELSSNMESSENFSAMASLLK
jgi:hypothetical protein